jgi:Sulfatase
VEVPGKGGAGLHKPAAPPWWRPAVDGLPPSPLEMALALLIGGVLHAFTDAIAIEVVVPWPAAGLTLRLWHHFFALLEAVGLAALPASVLLAFHGLAPRRRWWLLAGYTVVAVGVMYLVLGGQLRRQASVLLDGRLYPVLFPVYVVLCGLAVVAAHVVGAAASRVGALASVAFGLGLGGIVVAHAIHRDDHPELHLAIIWVSALVAGGALVPRVRRRFRSTSDRVALLAAGLVLSAWLWAPPNRVRLELFREPGAVAPWALAQLAWRAPTLDVEAKPPAAAAFSESTWAQARWGLPRNAVVVLLTVDALRADVVTSGLHDHRLPKLAALRDRSAMFTQATSAGAQTSVALTSLFSERFFSQLRWDYYGDGRTRFHYAAGDDTPRFVDRLSAHGVDTRSVLGLAFLAGRYGVARGFTHERMVVEGRRHALAGAVMGPLFSELDRVGKGPAFLYAHLMEPHEPYDRGKRKEGPAFERYLSEIAVVDRWVGKLMKKMRKRFRRRAYIIVTSDHGEAFGEHGTKFHTKTLYEELVHVPLMIDGVGIPARRIDEPVSIIDIGPTLSHLFGLEPTRGSSGMTLLPLARGLDASEGGGSRPVLSEGRLRRAMRDGSIKVIEDTVRKTVEVYDLELDPGETRNLFDERDPTHHGHVATMRRWFAEHTPAGYDPPYKP